MSIEDDLLAHLSARGTGWATSQEIACEVGYPWRSVARVLLRMPEVERQVTTWVSSRYRVRDCYVFRYIPPPTATYPSWMLPPAQPVPTNAGRVIKMKD